MPARKKASDIQPTEVLYMRQLVDEEERPVALFMIYRDNETPRSPRDTINVKPDPVMLRLVDTKNKLIEQTLAANFGSALDYGDAFARKHKLTLTKLRG